MPRPSNNQKRFLRSLGLERPKTWQAAAALIAFLKEGNGAGKARTQEERLALFRTTASKYQGQRIMPNAGRRKPVIVLSVIPKLSRRVECDCQAGLSLDAVSPFHVLVVEEGRPAQAGNKMLADLGAYHLPAEESVRPK